MRTSRLAGLVAAGAMLLTLAAPATAASNAQIRVLHGSPDAPAVDVYANGGKILSNIAFGTLTPYLAVPANTYAVRVCVAGSDGTVDANCPIIASLTFDAGKKYTIAASDVVKHIKADVFVDGPATAGKASVRVVHLSAGTPAVDVLTQDGMTKVFDNVAYPNATAYGVLAPATYDLKVCLHSDNTACPSAVDPAPLALAANTAYSVFAIGALDTKDGKLAGLKLVVGVDDVVVAPTDTVPAGSSPAAFLLVLAGLALAGLATRRVLATAATR